MKRTAGLALVLASTLALVACSSDADDPPRFQEATPSLTDELARLTGARCASGKYCYRTQGTFKSFAETGPDGRAVCHDEPQAD